jgi:hypothetical protein
MAFWHGEVRPGRTPTGRIKLRELCVAKGVRSLLHAEPHAAALQAAGIGGLKAYDRAGRGVEGNSSTTSTPA